MSQLKTFPVCLSTTSAAVAAIRGTSSAMADKEKHRSGATPPGMPDGKAARSDSDREFLEQAGVGELIREAILKMVEARSDDPIGFLADHFCHLASMTESGDALGAGPQEQQHLNRALWHLRLVHHSQRSASDVFVTEADQTPLNALTEAFK